MSPSMAVWWDRLFEQTRQMGVLSAGDGPALKDLAYWERMVEKMQSNLDALVEAGEPLTWTSAKGFSGMLPEVAELHRAQTEVNRLRAKFGLTPSDRGQVEKVPEPKSKLSEFVG